MPPLILRTRHGSSRRGWHGGSTIIRCAVDSCWSCFKWGLLLSVLGGLVAVPFLYTRVDEEIRRRVEEKLQSHYANLTVRVRFAKLLEGEGIEVRDVFILDPTASDPQAELAYIDEIFIACGTELSQLATGLPPIEHIYLRRPRIRLTRESDGSWHGGQLWPPPKLSEHPADITIENGVLQCSDPTRQPASLFTSRELNLAIKHQHPDGRHVMHVAGSVTGDHLRRIVLEGQLEPEAHAAGVTGTIDGLDFSPEFLAALPADLAGQLASLSALRAQANIEFRLAYNPAAATPLTFQSTSRVSRGRIDDPRLPFPLVDLEATVHANTSGVLIEKLVARNGQTTLELSGRRDGYAATSPAVLELKAEQMTLDRRLFETLPQHCREIWPKFYPAGVVDVDARVTFNGTAWKPERVTIDCLDLSFQYHDFPYRLERATGRLTFENDTLEATLTAFAGADDVQITGKFVNPGPHFTGKVTVEARRARFDDRLFAALKDAPRKVVRSLNPSGTFQSVFTCWREPGETAVHKHIWGRFNGCSLQYEKFPYPLANIIGDFQMTDGHWTFTGLKGFNDTGIVRCDGHLVPLAQGSELVLHFEADAVPLEPELRDALDARGCRNWDLLRPRGAIDLRDCTERYLSAQKGIDLHFRLLPHGELSSIHPVPFPYVLDKLQGAVVYRNGHVEFENIRGWHGRTQFKAKGSSACMSDGGWHLRFDDLVIDRLYADRDLLVALPERLRKAVLALNPTGQMNLRGGLNFYGAAGSPHPPEASWDAVVQLRGGTLDAGVQLTDLEGSVRLVGGFDGQQAQSWGDVNFDSLIWKDFQFTDVAGPLWIDDTRVIVGNGAEPPGKAKRHLTGVLCGGAVAADCWVALGPTPRYQFQASLVEADLARFAQEAVAGRQKLSGKVAANLELRGEGRGLYALSGRGNLTLRDADIYELPLMVALLKILSVRPPDATAFTESDMQFWIKGNHVYFNRLNFNGDAISLRGSGEMDFDRQIKLNFHAAVGKRELNIPIVRELMKGASQQFMQIQVTGSVDAPVTNSVAFPGVNQAFRELEAGLLNDE
jgi:hypothetical protein